MAKGTYKPASMLDPLKDLKMATSEGTPISTIVAQPQISTHEHVAVETASLAAESFTSTETHKQSVAPVKPLAATVKTSRTTIYLYPEDITKLRKITAYVAGIHGIRANESSILRAALFGRGGCSLGPCSQPGNPVRPAPQVANKCPPSKHGVRSSGFLKVSFAQRAARAAVLLSAHRRLRYSLTSSPV